MPRSPEQNQAVKDKRRAKLLDNALKVFAVLGYDEVSIDSITKSARCSHGLFYHYFTSKEEAFGYVWDELIDGAFSAPPLAEALEKGGTAGLDFICHAYDMFASLDAKKLCVAQIAITACHIDSLPDSIKQKAEKYDMRSALATLIKQAQEEGNAIAGDPDEIAYAIFTVFLTEIKQACLNKHDRHFTSGDVLFGMLMKKPLSEIH